MSSSNSSKKIVIRVLVESLVEIILNTLWGYYQLRAPLWIVWLSIIIIITIVIAIYRIKVYQCSHLTYQTINQRIYKKIENNNL